MPGIKRLAPGDALARLHQMGARPLSWCAADSDLGAPRALLGRAEAVRPVRSHSNPHWLRKAALDSDESSAINFCAMAAFAALELTAAE